MGRLGKGERDGERNHRVRSGVGRCRKRVTPKDIFLEWVRVNRRVGGEKRAFLSGISRAAWKMREGR